MKSFVFPGQGAQTIGMGQALADAYPAAKAIFDEVDDALDEKLSDMIWSGDIADLTLTRNAQPALMATSLAAMRALEAEGVTIAAASFVAGHSLGEYSALAASGALSVSDTARLLRIRGDAMQLAVPVGIGAMAVLLGMDFEGAQAVAAEAAADGEVCQAANDNDPSQVVVSGHKAAVERAVEIAKANGAKRAMLLPVSAPFHSSLMAPAGDIMAAALAEVNMNAPAVPLVANVRAEAVGVDDIKSLLVEQVTGSVRWRESVQWMAGAGVTEVWEIGAGKALSGMVKRIDRGIATRNIGTPDDVKAAVAAQNSITNEG